MVTEGHGVLSICVGLVTTVHTESEGGNIFYHSNVK